MNKLGAYIITIASLGFLIISILKYTPKTLFYY